MLQKGRGLMVVINRLQATSDINRARNILANTSASLVVVRGSQTWQYFGRGIKPLYELLTIEGPKLKGGALADKVMGKAAALLTLHAGLASSYAKVMSRPAYNLLLANNINVTCDILVEHILNREQTGFCPMETLTANITDPDEAYRAVGEKLEQWANEKL